jgi:hypothetical protein
MAVALAQPKPQAQHQPPSDVMVDAQSQDHQGHDRTHDQAQRLHGKHQADQFPAVFGVGEFTHQHGGHRVVATNPKPHDKPENQEPQHTRGKCGEHGANGHNGRFQSINRLAAKHIRQPAKHKSSQKCRNQGG